MNKHTRVFLAEPYRSGGKFNLRRLRVFTDERKSVRDGDYLIDRRAGLSLGFSVHNDTMEKVYVHYPIGVSMTINPLRDKMSDDYYDDVGDVRSPRLNVFFSIEDYRDLRTCINPDTAPPIDLAIMSTLHRHLSEKKNEVLEIEKRIAKNKSRGDMIPHISYSCVGGFSIPLYQIKPNVGLSGYRSDLLNVTIVTNLYDITDVGKVNAKTVKRHYESCIEENMGDIEDCYFKILKVVDNENDIGPIWSSELGQPTKIKPVRDSSLPSGIYVYTSSNINTGKPHVFIPTNKITEEGLNELGISSSQYGIKQNNLTKEHSDLRKAFQAIKEKLIAKEREIEEIIKAKNTEIEKIKETCGKEIKALTEKVSIIQSRVYEANLTIKHMSNSHEYKIRELTSELNRQKTKLADYKDYHSDKSTLEKLNERTHKNLEELTKMRDISNNARKVLDERVAEIRKQEAERAKNGTGKLNTVSNVLKVTNEIIKTSSLIYDLL